MGAIQEYLLLLIPLVIIQFGLMIAALVHIFKHDTYNTGNRVLWVIVCLCVNMIGPILYFILGRSEGENE
ncbi:MAG: PLD nuclease N-terminal domain-containing protein [Oscillospiraceae bacterium]|nr:PLD nuclease N-terminal domain-containing protein [Oscillospiraceae bacterium]